MIQELETLLSAINPGTGEIAKVFGAFSKFSPETRQLIFAGLDDRVIKKFADWSAQFTETLNTIGTVDAAAAHRIIDPTVSDDFISVMSGTKYQGTLLDQTTISEAQNTITKAIKSNNYLQAIDVGMVLAGALPI